MFDDDDGCIYVQLSKSEHALINSNDVEETVALSALYEVSISEFGHRAVSMKFYSTVALLLAAGF